MKKNLLLSPTPPLPQRKKTIDYEVEQGWSSAFGSCISRDQGAKKVIFTACHSGKLKLTFTSPNVISTSPKNVLISRLISQFFCNLNSSKKLHLPVWHVSPGQAIGHHSALRAWDSNVGLRSLAFL